MVTDAAKIDKLRLTGSVREETQHRGILEMRFEEMGSDLIRTKLIEMTAILLMEMDAR